MKELWYALSWGFDPEWQTVFMPEDSTNADRWALAIWNAVLMLLPWRWQVALDRLPSRWSA